MPRVEALSFVAEFSKEENWYNIKLFCELEGVVRGADTGRELWAAGALIANEAERMTREQYDELCQVWWEKKKRVGGYAPPALFDEDKMFSANSRRGAKDMDKYLRNRIAEWVAG